MQLTAAWVRRKRFEALIAAQAFHFGPTARKSEEPQSRDDFWAMLESIAVVENVEAGHGNQAG